MPDITFHLTLHVDEDDLWALAQFIKRAGWQEYRQNATDDSEAHRIRAGVDALQRALAEEGYDPR
jgi:hypothetical protein